MDVGFGGLEVLQQHFCYGSEDGPSSTLFPRVGRSPSVCRNQWSPESLFHSAEVVPDELIGHVKLFSGHCYRSVLVDRFQDLRPSFSQDPFSVCIEI